MMDLEPGRTSCRRVRRPSPPPFSPRPSPQRRSRRERSPRSACCIPTLRTRGSPRCAARPFRTSVTSKARTSSSSTEGPTARPSAPAPSPPSSSGSTWTLSWPTGRRSCRPPGKRDRYDPDRGVLLRSARDRLRRQSGATRRKRDRGLGGHGGPFGQEAGAAPRDGPARAARGVPGLVNRSERPEIRGPHARRGGKGRPRGPAILRWGPAEFDGAFSAMARSQPEALIIQPLFTDHRRRIVEFAMRHRLPTLSDSARFAEEGGLMTYGEMFRQVARYADEILKSAKPPDSVPSALLLQADRVIE